jgi:hypothetical protein
MRHRVQQVSASSDFLDGGGEMGARMRAYDWSKTALGPPEQWPQNLQTAVSTCLHCSFPIVIWWGRDLILLYNDAYCSILANKTSTGFRTWLVLDGVRIGYFVLTQSTIRKKI